jgi:uncharacterized protein (TIGR02996 family)
MQSDRQGLIAAIRDNPDDDTPRLVCADWFEEQGGESNIARAEFIRTQVERARLELDDPRQSELESRELRILKQHAAGWCRSHFLFKKVRFRRGFIEYVHLHLQHFLHHRRQILSLEPIRDVSLTGWMRANDDLVRRVAACEELRHIETIRIHNQGPHKWPRSNVVTLIESPHLSRLKSLRLPSLNLDAEARQRFERASVLSKIEELSLPSLDTYPNNPGPWFSEGARGLAWKNLRSLRINDSSVRPEIIARLSEMPFWNQLRSLSLNLPYHQSNEVLLTLRDRLPPSLEELRIVASHSPVQVPDAHSFFERLAGVPLRVLKLQWIPLSSAALGRMFADDSRCELESLTLSGCRLTEQHADVLVRSNRAEQLKSINLNDYPTVPAVAAIQSRLGDGVEAEVRTAGDNSSLDSLGGADWPARIRSLTISADRVSRAPLLRLLASPRLRNLVRLSISDMQAELVVDRALARQLVDLPSLSYLKLMVGRIDEDARPIFEDSESLLWTTLITRDDPGSYPGNPNRMPPLDQDLAGLDEWY